MNHLSYLEDAGLIALAQHLPEAEYLFHHALVQEATYQSLLRKDRQWLHQAVGTALESVYPDCLDELAPTLAYHFCEAGDHAKALDYYCRAGERSLARYANQEAEMVYRAGLKIARSAFDRARLMAGLGEALSGQGRMFEAIRVWSEAVELYREDGHHHHVALMVARAARAAWWAGDPPGALDLCEAALASIPDDLETQGMAALLHEKARACYFTGHPADALALCHRALGMAERLNLPAVQADALNTLGTLHQGQRSIDYLTRAVRVAEGAGLLAVAGHAYYNLALEFMQQCELSRASAYAKRAATLGKRRGSVVDQLYSVSLLLVIRLMRGDFAKAARLAMDVTRLIWVMEHSTAAGLAMARLAVYHRFIGAHDQARHLFQCAQAGARQARDTYNLCRISNQMLEFAFETQQWAEMHEILPETLALTHADVSEAALTHTLACKISAVQGDFAEAHHLLAEGVHLAGENPPARAAFYLLHAAAYLAGSEARWDEALGRYNALFQRYQKSNMHLYGTLLLGEMAELYLKRGGTDDLMEAQRLLCRREAEFEAMGVAIGKRRELYPELEGSPSRASDSGRFDLSPPVDRAP